MAIRYSCPCGAAIRLPESTAGRRARCKQCGDVFTVPQTETLRTTPQPVVDGNPWNDRPDLTDDVERSFWSDLALSFVLFLDPHNLATCIGLMVMLVVAMAASILPFAGMIVGTLVMLYLLRAL